LAGTIHSYGAHRVPRAVGYESPSAGHQVVDLFRTEPVEEDFDWLRDAHRYGGLFGQLVMTGQALAGQLSTSPPWSREHGCYHENTDGVVGPLLQLDPWYDTILGSHHIRVATTFVGGDGFRATTPYNRHRLYEVHSYAISVPPGFHYWQTLPFQHPYVDTPYATTTSVLEDIEAERYIGRGRITGRVWPFSVVVGVFLDTFSFERTEVGGLQADYTFRIVGEGWSDVGVSAFRGRYEQFYVHPRTDSTIHPLFGETISTYDGAFTAVERWTCECLSTTKPTEARALLGDAAVAGKTTVAASDQPLILPMSDVSYVVDTRVIQTPTLLAARSALSPRDFYFAVGLRMNDIRNSAFQSTSAAMEEVTHNIGTNLLEQLSQVEGYLHYLPDLPKALRAVTSLSTRPLRSIRDVIDFLADLRLRQSFSYGPDAAMIDEVLPAMARLVSHLMHIEAELAVGRGIFRYTFPEGEFGRPLTTLETRTKVVVRRDPTSLLAKFLGVDAMGISPIPSNLWDLIPFSFVLDWFTGIGGRIRDLEVALELALSGPQYLCHTYKVATRLTKAELAEHDLMNFNVDGVVRSPFEWRVFNREVSRFVPTPKDGRYDFGLPGSQPPWLTALSLGWSVFT